MLRKIIIKNIALIDALEITLHKGLQVITGETGAGKSIILGALRLIMGERADPKSVANPELKSIVEAEFEVDIDLQAFFDEHDLDFDEITIIRREILPSGKSRAFVNDVPVTLDVLKQLAGHLIDIHSQFETSQLFNEEYQFNLIDGLGQNKALVQEFQSEFATFSQLQKDVAALRNQLSEGTKEADYKDFLLSELEEAQLDDIDLEELQNQLNTQENVGAISENLTEIFARIDQEEVGLLDTFTEIKNKMSKIGSLSHQFTELEDRLSSNFLELKDIIFELHDKAENIEADPKLLDELNAKFNKINALFLKHQVQTIEELVTLRNTIAEEQGNFADLENKISETESLLTKQEIQLQKLADQLSKNRKKTVPLFKQKMETVLQNLGLEKAKIDFKLTDKTDFNPFGKEQAEILFQANSGFPMQPIQKAISGGERSRVMLAVKKLMAENTQLPTLILDEIDTGVSGKIASEMGTLMKEMSKNRQLIVITHLAQVAAKGDHNYKVMKEDIAQKTQSNIISLNDNEKLQEIAQLLSGKEITDAALQQAEELMK